MRGPPFCEQLWKEKGKQKMTLNIAKSTGNNEEWKRSEALEFDCFFII